MSTATIPLKEYNELIAIKQNFDKKVLEKATELSRKRIDEIGELLHYEKDYRREEQREYFHLHKRWKELVADYNLLKKENEKPWWKKIFGKKIKTCP